MTGSVYRKGNGWAYRFDIGPDPLTGKRRQPSKAGYRTEREAQKALRDAIGLYEQGRHVAPSRITVGELLAEWHAAAKTSLRATTWVGYGDYITAYVTPLIGGVRLQGGLTTQRLNLLYARLLESGRVKQDSNGRMYAHWRDHRRHGKEPTAAELAKVGAVTYDAARKALRRYQAGRLPKEVGAGLAPKTVRNVHEMLRRALGDAVKWGYVVRNVAEDATRPRVGRHEWDVWSPAQLQAFVKHVGGDPFYAMWLLACTTGLRRGELCGLRRRDVDLDAATVTPPRPRVVVDGHPQESEPKTSSGRRAMSLDPVTADALRTHIEAWAKRKAEFGLDTELLFVWADGTAFHPDTVTEWFARHTDAAGLPPIRLHGVRHSYATAALKAGVHVKIVSQRLGHSSVAFTLDTYSHVIDGMDAEAAKLIADVILGTDTGAASPLAAPDVHESVHPNPLTNSPEEEVKGTSPGQS